MRLMNLPILLAAIVILPSCTTTKNQIYWVSGVKTECTSGEGKTTCLNVHKGKDLDKTAWQIFYANIEGFNFQEGYLKKIEVKEEAIDPKNIPADGSSIKYKMVKELEKIADNRIQLKGKWTLGSLSGNPINRSTVVPTLEIALDQMRISGRGGCNNYNSKIEQLQQKIVKLSNVVSTRKACMVNNIEQEYFTALNNIRTYVVKDEKLTFYDETGKELLFFIKQNEPIVPQLLNNKWIATSIDGNTINRKENIPLLEINLKENTAFGSDGCNRFSGVIENLTEKKMQFGNMAVTSMMCAEMALSDSFNKVMNKVASYKISEMKLTLFDSEGKEILSFKKEN